MVFTPASVASVIASQMFSFFYSGPYAGFIFLEMMVNCSCILQSGTCQASQLIVRSISNMALCMGPPVLFKVHSIAVNNEK